MRSRRICHTSVTAPAVRTHSTSDLALRNRSSAREGEGSSLSAVPISLRYHHRVTSFTTTREAKEFLIAQIVQEAEREAPPLTDVERRMLYFTETAWMPEDTWQASEVFDRDYDMNTYEQRIGQLTTSLKQRPDHDKKDWNAAVRLLKTEDHCLLVLINPALQISVSQGSIVPLVVKFVLIGLGLVLLLPLAKLALHFFYQLFPY